jgi:hypothetical protein
MQVISSRHINAYTKCPKKLQLDWSSYSTNVYGPAEFIVSSTIQTIFLYQSKFQKWPRWKTVIGWVERFIAEYSREETELDYKESKGYLSLISSWYDNCQEFLIPGLPNVPISLELSPRVFFRDCIPLVFIKDNFILADFFEADKHYNKTNLFNDLELMIKIWGFWKFTRYLPEKIVRFVITPLTIKSLPILLTQKRMLHIEQIVEQIIRGIHHSIFYPSITKECYTCLYKNKCFL